MTDKFAEFYGEQPLERRWAEGVRPVPATAPVPIDEAGAEDREYRPWGRECPDVSDVLEIRRKDGSWKQINRSFLVGVDGVGDHLVTLVCTAFAVTLSGTNLAELRTRLKTHTIDYVQEFDPIRWPMPPAGGPVIDRIEILELRAPRIGQGTGR